MKLGIKITKLSHHFIPPWMLPTFKELGCVSKSQIYNTTTYPPLMSPIFRVRGCVSKLRNFYTNKYPMDIANFYGTKLRIKMTKLQYHYIPPWMFVFWKTRDFLSCVFSLSEMGWAMPTCDRSIHFQKNLASSKAYPIFDMPLTTRIFVSHK